MKVYFEVIVLVNDKSGRKKQEGEGGKFGSVCGGRGSRD